MLFNVIKAYSCFDQEVGYVASHLPHTCSYAEAYCRTRSANTRMLVHNAMRLFSDLFSKCFARFLSPSQIYNIYIIYICMYVYNNIHNNIKTNDKQHTAHCTFHARLRIRARAHTHQVLPGICLYRCLALNAHARGGSF